MPTQTLSIPLTQGLGEHVDPKFMPGGLLKQAINVRIRKDGRFGKRYGIAALTHSFSEGEQRAVSGLYQLGPQKLMAQCGLLYKYSDDRESLESCGPISPFLPDRERVVVQPDSQNYGPSDFAYLDGYVGVIYTNADDAVVDTGTGVYILVYEEATGTVVYQETADTGTINDVRVTTVTDGIVFVWANANQLRQRVLTVSTLTMSSTVDVVAINDGFDVTEGTGIAYLLAYGSSGDISVCYVTASTGGISAPTVVTVTDTPVRPSIKHCTERVYVSCVCTGGTTPIKAFSLNTSLGGASAVTTLNASGGVLPAGIIRRDASSAWFFWTNDNFLFVNSVSSTGTLGTEVSYESMSLASEPFAASLDAFDGDSKVFFWVRTQAEDFDDSRYHLVCLESWESKARSDVLLPLLSTESVGYADALVYGMFPSSVYQTSDNRLLFRAPIVRLATSGETLIGQSVFSVNVMASASYEGALCSRPAVARGNTLYVAGGSPMFFDGRRTGELGIRNVPEIRAASPSAGGSLSAGSNYSYIAVYEYLDAAGNLHQSSPSTVQTVSTGVGDGTVTLTIQSLQLTHMGTMSGDLAGRDVQVALYRTQAGGSIYYRLAERISAYSPGSVVDTASDSSIGDNGVLYTQGGVLPHVAPPACRYIAASETRGLIAGLFDRSKYWFSKLFYAGEPMQFTDDPGFWGNVDGDITAVAFLDGVAVIFTATSIHVVTGEGPDDTGVGQFSPPRRLPSDVGCIDHRSLLEVGAGLMFQSERGIYLLPRGFATPQFIGQPVSDTLASYPVITSAVLVQKSDESLARFTLAASDSFTDEDAPAGRVLTLDLRTGQWMVDSYNSGQAYFASAMWDGVWTVARPVLSLSNPLQQETTGFTDLGNAITQTLELGDLRPFGMQGRGLVRSLEILGEYRGDTAVLVEASYDGGVTYPDSRTFTLSGLSSGATVARQWGVPRIQIDEVRLRLTSTELVPTEGFVFNGITLQIDPRRGARRFASGER